MVIQDIHLKIDHQKHHTFTPVGRVSLTFHQNGEMDLKPWRQLGVAYKRWLHPISSNRFGSKKNSSHETRLEVEFQSCDAGRQKKATDV